MKSKVWQRQKSWDHPEGLHAGAMQEALTHKNRKQQTRLSVNYVPKPNLWLIGLPRDGEHCWHRQEAVYLNSLVPWPVLKCYFLLRKAKAFSHFSSSWAETGTRLQVGAAYRKHSGERSMWDDSLTFEVNHQLKMWKCYQPCGLALVNFINRWIKWACFGPAGRSGRVTVPLITVLM